MKSKTEQEDAREFVETTEQKDQQELPAVIDAELEILFKAFVIRTTVTQGKNQIMEIPFSRMSPRYTFWPMNKGKLAAFLVYGGLHCLAIAATLTPNEGIHSILGIILRKQRNRLTHAHAADYTLMQASYQRSLRPSKK